MLSGAFGYVLYYAWMWMAFLSLVVHTWCFFRFYPRTRRRASALIFGNGLVFLCLLGAAFLAGESYFRFISVRTDSFGMSLPARRWFLLHTELNTLGCRDVEWTPAKPQNVRRIAFIGDSFTYGWGIEDTADRLTERLQERFDRTAPGSVQVMNVAKPGWGTKDQINPLHDLITRYGVNEIVLCHVPNDIEKLIPVMPTFNPTRPPEPAWFDPDSSALLDFLHRRLIVPRLPTVRGYHDWLAGGYADEAVWRAQQQLFYEMIQYCRERDVTFRVALLPFTRTGGDKLRIEPLHALLRSFFEVHGVPVVDLWPVVASRDPSDLEVNASDSHPNATAHALFAEALWSAFWDTGG